MRNLVLVTCIVTMLGAGFTAKAQQPLLGTGYVHTEYLFSLHPLHPEVQRLTEAARAEIGAIGSTIQQLQDKQQLGTISPAESELLLANYATLTDLQARYDEEIRAVAEPMRLAVDVAVREVASRLSLGMVLDARVAFDLDLVVYAASANDITALVAEQLLATLED